MKIILSSLLLLSLWNEAAEGFSSSPPLSKKPQVLLYAKSKKSSDATPAVKVAKAKKVKDDEQQIEVIDRLQQEWEEEMDAFMKDTATTKPKTEVVDEVVLEMKYLEELEKEMKAFMKNEENSSTITTTDTYVDTVSKKFEKNWNVVNNDYNAWQKEMNTFVKTLSKIPIKNEKKDNKLINLHKKWEKELDRMDEYLKNV